MTQLRTEQSFHALQLRCKFAGVLNDAEARIRTEDLQGPLVQLTSLFCIMKSDWVPRVRAPLILAVGGRDRASLQVYVTSWRANKSFSARAGLPGRASTACHCSSVPYTFPVSVQQSINTMDSCGGLRRTIPMRASSCAIWKFKSERCTWTRSCGEASRKLQLGQLPKT